MIWFRASTSTSPRRMTLAYEKDIVRSMYSSCFIWVSKKHEECVLFFLWCNLHRWGKKKKKKKPTQETLNHQDNNETLDEYQYTHFILILVYFIFPSEVWQLAVQDHTSFELIQYGRKPVMNFCIRLLPWNNYLNLVPNVLFTHFCSQAVI